MSNTNNTHVYIIDILHCFAEIVGYSRAYPCTNVAPPLGVVKEASRGKDVASGITREEKKRESVGLGFFTTSNPNLPTQEDLSILLEVL